MKRGETGEEAIRAPSGKREKGKSYKLMGNHRERLNLYIILGLLVSGSPIKYRPIDGGEERGKSVGRGGFSWRGGGNFEVAKSDKYAVERDGWNNKF